jgi:hypothetical protein
MASPLEEAILLCCAFGLVLFMTARNERRRGDASAPTARRDLRTALGNALVEGVVMIGAVLVTIVAVMMRKH